MFDARPTTPRFQTLLAAILLTASWTGLAAADPAPGETGYRVPAASDQWHAPGDTPYANSQVAATSSVSSASTNWQLPNGQSADGNSQAAGNDASNPLRQSRKPQPATPSREPRAFKAPTNAAPLKASQSAAVSNTNHTAQQRSTSTSAAVANKPAQAIKQAYVPTRALPSRAPAANQHPAAQSAVWSMGYNESKANSTGDDLWQTINVAFQGQPNPNQPTPKQPAAKKRVVEDLPMPGDFDREMQEPVMRQPSGPDAFHRPVGGPYYHPYGDQGNCCDENGCPNGACPNGGCGDGVCEPGCGCPCGEPCGEPGCECPSNSCCPACGRCNKDVFCIGPGDDESCHIVQVRWPKWQEVVVFGGVQGFKGPYDRGRDSGNFGFNEGFNIGAKIPYAEMGYQYGYRAAESQLNGDKNTGIEHQFLQEFVTAGLFHRCKEGMQFGVVWDGLIDERSPSKNFHQIRSEFSVLNGCNEIGFGATVGLNSHKVDDGTNTENDVTFQASDQYVLFYRLHGCNGGEGRIYAGVNNDSDGILGSDMLIPIGDRFSVQSGFTYLIPNKNDGREGATQEAWNIGMGLVWHWDGQARKCFENRYRPMFNVADNGLLIVDRQ